MEPENLSIDQLTISFGEFQDLDAEGDSLSDFLLSVRSDEDKDAKESRVRVDNGRAKPLTIPKLTVRRHSGSSQSGKSKSDTLSPIQSRRFSVPRYGGPSPPILPERRCSEPRKLGIEQFVTYEEENALKMKTSQGNSQGLRQTNSTQLMLGVDSRQALGQARLLTQPDNLARSYEHRSEGSFRSERLPALDKAKTRKHSAPAAQIVAPRDESAPMLADIMVPQGRKKVLSPLPNLPTRSELPMNFPTKTQPANGRNFSPNSYVSAEDFKIPLTAKLTEQLGNEPCLLKGQNPIEKKRGRYGLEGNISQDMAAQSMWNQDEPSIAGHALRTTSHAIRCRNTGDTFDAMFEA